MMQRILPKFLVLLVATVTMTTLAATPVSAARTKTQTTQTTGTPVGNDISWPQCGKAYPANQAFGIVGVTGGLANNTNPCLSSQLVWAAFSSGATAQQAKVQLYVNTANPGGLGTASWPRNNVDPSGVTAPNPYGLCDNSDSLACAWQYGWNRSVEAVVQRFQPAARSIALNADPALYPWWLDVEIENTWKTGTSGRKSNVADLEGMAAYFRSRGATLGIYSTSYQWGQIAGTVSPSLSGLPSWLAGATTLAGAQANCSKPPLTPGSRVVLTQYVMGSFDYNYSCV